MSGAENLTPGQGSSKAAAVFHPNAVKWTVFTVLAYGLLTLSAALLDGRDALTDALSLGWDIVFCYFLFRGKNWARIVLIIRAALILFLLQFNAWSQQNALGAVMDGGIGLSILGLLFSLQKPLRAQILAGIAGAFFIMVMSLYLYGMQEKQAESSILRQLPDTREFRAEPFRISLPAAGWKWLPKEHAVRLMGETAEGCEAGFAKTDSTGYGLIFFEKVNTAIDKEVMLAQAQQAVKDKYFSKLAVTSSTAVPDGAMTLAEGTFLGQPYAYVSIYKIFAPGKALHAILWAEQTRKDALRQDAERLMASVSEF